MNKPSLKRYRTLLSFTLLDFFREHLILSEFTGNAYGTDILPSQAYILLEFQENPKIKLNELSRILAISQSTISRGVAHLISVGYLTKESGYYLTALGFQFIELQEQFNQKQIKKLSAGLTPEEIRKFANYFWRLAEDQQAPKLTTLNNSLYELIKISIRRVSRLYQIIGNKVFKSSWSSLDWLMLAEIGSQELAIGELALRLKVPFNTLSQRLKIYQEKGLIELLSHDTDQRIKILALSNSGEEALREIENAAVKIFDQGFKNWSIAEIEEYLNLLAKYVKGDLVYRSARLDDECYLIKAGRPDEFQALRWLMIKILSKHLTQKDQLSDHFFSSKNRCFSIFKNNRLVGGIELVAHSYCEYKVVNMIFDSKLSDMNKEQISEALQRLVGSKFKFIFLLS